MPSLSFATLMILIDKFVNIFNKNYAMNVYIDNSTYVQHMYVYKCVHYFIFNYQ